MDINIKTDKKEYFKCSMYYMRRYFGLRETILLAVLFVAALLLYLLADLILIFIFFGLTLAVLLVTVLLFVWTSVMGYKHDTEKQGIALEKLHFDTDELRVEFFNNGGEMILNETHKYPEIEAVVIKKNFIYIYAAIAIFYYIKRDRLEEGQFGELALFLRENVPEEKFKFKQVKRMFPKKKKIKFEIEDKKDEEKK